MRSAYTLRLVLLLVWACAMLGFAWTGFIASDDEHYASSGLGWLHSFPYVAQTFGEVRAMVGLPIAGAVGVLGESEFSIVLSTCLFFLATLVVTMIALERAIGGGPALAITAAMATMPLLAINATIPNADIPELFFVASSFWLFHLACEREPRFWLLLLAGVLAGLAFSTHEVSAALLLFYGLLFLAGHAIPRRQYWIMAIGFGLVVLVEAVYYLALTGNPAYRFDLMLHGAGLRDRADVGAFQFTPAGNLHVWAPIDPVILFFTHVHQFSVLALLAIPALWWVIGGCKGASPRARRLVQLLAILAAVWLVFAAAALTNQKLLPRYYTVCAYSLVLVVGIWVTVSLWPRRRGAAVAAGAAFVAVSLASIGLANTNPRFGERSLAQYLQRSAGEVVYTDPMTAAKTVWYCRWAKVDCQRIVAGAPPAGALYFYNPKYADSRNRLVRSEDVAAYRPQDDWEQLWRSERPRTGLVRVMAESGIAAVLPDRLAKKLEPAKAFVAVYRVAH
jgi:4-amino-4-deoxy-L-arabinose transferase-like glycosyltransferase